VLNPTIGQRSANGASQRSLDSNDDAQSSS